MTLAWLELSIKLVIIAHVVVSLLLILVILMQRPKQEGLGAAFGSGMTDAAWGARTTDVLQKGTVYLGTLFFVFTLVLAILMGKKNSEEGKLADGKNEVLDEVAEVVEPEVTDDSAKVDAFKETLEKAEAADAAKKEEETQTPADASTEKEEEEPEPAKTDTPAGQ